MFQKLFAWVGDLFGVTLRQAAIPVTQEISLFVQRNAKTIVQAIGVTFWARVARWSLVAGIACGFSALFGLEYTAILGICALSLLSTAIIGILVEWLIFKLWRKA